MRPFLKLTLISCCLFGPKKQQAGPKLGVVLSELLWLRFTGSPMPLPNEPQTTGNGQYLLCAANIGNLVSNLTRVLQPAKHNVSGVACPHQERRSCYVSTPSEISADGVLIPRPEIRIGIPGQRTYTLSSVYLPPTSEVQEIIRVCFMFSSKNGIFEEKKHVWSHMKECFSDQTCGESTWWACVLWSQMIPFRLEREPKKK